MKSEHLAIQFPISQILASDVIMNFLADSNDNPLYIGDLGSGENTEVPIYFSKYLHDSPQITALDNSDAVPQIITYCVDLHLLRLESLYNQLVEEDVIEHSRVVHSRLESMTDEAIFPDQQKSYLLSEESCSNPVDLKIIDEEKIPSDVFDICVLNYDIIGYILEYYKEYSDIARSLSGTKSVLRPGGLLVMTHPCALYPYSPVDIMEEHGFSFVHGLDMEKSSGKTIELKDTLSPNELSRLDHYSFLIFKNI